MYKVSHTSRPNKERRALAHNAGPGPSLRYTINRRMSVEGVMKYAALGRGDNVVNEGRC